MRRRNLPRDRDTWGEICSFIDAAPKEFLREGLSSRLFG